MTLAQAGRLRQDDEVTVAGLAILGEGKTPSACQVSARVVRPWDGMRLTLRLGSGELMAIEAARLPTISRAGTPLNGIPREVVAFAAGVHATGTRNFRVIAATIDALGMGRFDPAALEMSVRDWTGDLMRDFDSAAQALGAAVRSTGRMPS